MALITTTEQLTEMVEFYSTVEAFAFDVETLGENRSNPLIANVVWISFATDGRSDVIPMGHPNGDLLREGPSLLLSGQRKLAAGKSRESLRPSDFSRVKIDREWTAPPEQLNRAEVFAALEPLFSGDALKVGHNLRFDLHAVAKYMGGVYPVGPYFDTLVASWVLDVSAKGSLGLADCFHRETGRIMKKGVGKDISLHSFQDVAHYSLLDAIATWDVYKSLGRKFRHGPKKLRDVLALEMMVIPPVLEMESSGVRIDKVRMAEIDADLRADLDRLEAEIFRAAGRTFNVRSNKDKQEILYTPKKNGGQGLRPKNRVPSAKDKPKAELTVHDYAVDHASLVEFRGKSRLIDLLLDYSARVKLHGTYVLPYLGGQTLPDKDGKTKRVESRLRNGRVYGQFNQFGTESGRFSSSNPNLQNIPSRTAEGRRLRETFVSEPGCILLAADYSQIEPRIIASLSGDRTLIDTYRDGGDVYQVVGDRMSVKRATGKELVLSIAYGVGAPTIAQRIQCTEREAKDLMEFFSDKFPSILRHKKSVVAYARRHKYSETLLGRRRPLPQITWVSKPEMVSAAERQAYNHLIQGTAADIMKTALVNMHGVLPPDTSLLMTVHDEAVLQVPESQVEEMIALVKAEMEGASPVPLRVPLVVDIHSGRTWLEAKG